MLPTDLRLKTYHRIERRICTVLQGRYTDMLPGIGLHQLDKLIAWHAMRVILVVRELQTREIITKDLDRSDVFSTMVGSKLCCQIICQCQQRRHKPEIRQELASLKAQLWLIRFDPLFSVLSAMYVLASLLRRGNQYAQGQGTS